MRCGLLLSAAAGKHPPSRGGRQRQLLLRLALVPAALVVLLVMVARWGLLLGKWWRLALLASRDGVGAVAGVEAEAGAGDGSQGGRSGSRKVKGQEESLRVMEQLAELWLLRKLPLWKLHRQQLLRQPKKHLLTWKLQGLTAAPRLPSSGGRRQQPAAGGVLGASAADPPRLM